MRVNAMEVLLNKCYGGFCFSDAFLVFTRSRGLIYEKYIDHNDSMRSDPILVSLVKTFGLVEAAGACCHIVIESVPRLYTWRIDAYDGVEELVTEFPWKRLALALLHKQDDDVLHAVRSGALVLP
jgi:hypothetical protein